MAFNGEEDNFCNERQTVQSDQVNLHILYVITGVAHDYQLRNAIKTLFKRHGISCNFKISLVTIRGEYFGYAYVYIENSSVFTRLTGVNPDGSRKTNIIPHPEWKKPKLPLAEALKQHNDKWTAKARRGGLNWADQSDMEEEEEIIKNKYERPTLEVPIDPELIIPSYTYTTEQKDHIRSRHEADSKEKGLETIEEVPDDGYFQVSVANVPRTKQNIQQHILCCTNIPPNITAQDLKTIFQIYAHDTRTKCVRRVNGDKVYDTYPFVCVIPVNNSNNYKGIKKYNSGNRAYVTFDEHSIDGKMAIYIMRKVHIVDRQGQQHMLIFDHPKVNRHKRN